MSVVARGIRVTLGRTEVLHGADLVARSGELTAIVGPNGSGKTTLLRALTGEVEHRGEVRLNRRPAPGLRHGSSPASAPCCRRRRRSRSPSPSTRSSASA